MGKIFATLSIVALLGAGAYFAGSYFSGDKNVDQQRFNPGQGPERLGLPNIEGVPQESPELQGRISSVEDSYLVVSKFNLRNFNGDNSSGQNRPDFNESPQNIDREEMRARMEEIRKQQEENAEQVRVNISDETRFIKVSMDNDLVQEISVSDIKKDDNITVWVQENGSASVVLLREINNQFK